MSRALMVRIEAEQDMAEARAWYDDQQAGLGIEFLESVQETFQRIREMPEMYAAIHKRVRRCKIRRFRYIVYYRIVEEAVEVIAVIDASRHSRVWRSRI